MANPIDVLMNERSLAIIIFITTYAYIALGRKEKQIAALVGATFVWILGIVSTMDMIEYIDFETLGLLFGMMVIVGALRESGFFRFIGLETARLSGYIPSRMFILTTLTTALLSALLANVTVVMFMTVMIIEITEMLKIDPKPFIIGEIMASNIGGAATIIGDPPNIMVATRINMTFLDFIKYIAPISIIALLASTLLIYVYYRKALDKEIITVDLPVSPSEVITDFKLLYVSYAVFVFTVIMFLVKPYINLSYSAIAILGSSILLFLGGEKMPQVLDDVEWSTLLFLGGLFIIIGGLDKTGIISDISRVLEPFLTGNIYISTTLVLWISALASAVIANIPFTAAFIPILMSITASSPDNPLWWALILGADFGGNTTSIGSSSNVVALDIMKERGLEISFMEYLKIGILILVVSVGVSNIILLLSFYLFS